VNDQCKLSAIIELARRLEIDVREANLGGDGGGLCQLRDRRILFIDASADLTTRYTRCLRDLAQLPEIDSCHMPPELREDLSAHR